MTPECCDNNDKQDPSSDLSCTSYLRTIQQVIAVMPKEDREVFIDTHQELIMERYERVLESSIEHEVFQHNGDYDLDCHTCKSKRTAVIGYGKLLEIFSQLA